MGIITVSAIIDIVVVAGTDVVPAVIISAYGGCSIRVVSVHGPGWDGFNPCRNIRAGVCRRGLDISSERGR